MLVIALLLVNMSFYFDDLQVAISFLFISSVAGTAIAILQWQGLVLGWYNLRAIILAVCSINGSLVFQQYQVGISSVKELIRAVTKWSISRARSLHSATALIIIALLLASPCR